VQQESRDRTGLENCPVGIRNGRVELELLVNPDAGVGGDADTHAGWCQLWAIRDLHSGPSVSICVAVGMSRECRIPDTCLIGYCGGVACVKRLSQAVVYCSESHVAPCGSC